MSTTTTLLELDPRCPGSHRIAVTLDYRRADGLSERGISFLGAAMRASHAHRCTRCNSYVANDRQAATMTMATEDGPCPK